jgi:amidase
MGDIVDMGLVELSGAIAARQVSCREVMAATLARIATVNGTFNAIVSLRDGDDCLRDADAADAALARGDRRGPLHGVPQAPKDLAATRDLPTTMGSPLLKTFRPPNDAFIVERARAAGAILIGKTNTPEFGLGSHTYNTLFGRTLNAWDTRWTAGGSSGGAAVALAQRMLAAADGSDMGGSLRNPAGWNGVVGFRPSRGTVPTGPGRDAFLTQLATDGAMGRTVRDVGLLLSVQVGAEPRAPLSLDRSGAPFAALAPRDLRGARIGWLGDLGGHLPTDPGVLDVCVAALRHFSALGATVEPFVPAFDWERLWRAWVDARAVLVAGALAPLAADPARRAALKPEMQWELHTAAGISAARFYEASVTRTEWALALLDPFRTYDALILPTAQVFPFDAALDWPREVGGRAMDTYHRWMEVAIGPTMAGFPVAAVPAGFTADGRPMGLQIVTGANDDIGALEIALAYEEASGFTALRPPEPTKA